MKDLRHCYRLLRASLLICAAVVGVIAAACSSDSAPLPSPTARAPASSAVPSPTAAPALTATPVPPAVETATPEPTPLAYDSNRAMYKVFPGFGRTSNRTFDALEEVRLNGDRSMVAVIVESMRFQSSANAREASAATLRELTGATYAGDEWKQWMEWLGNHRDEYPPPDEYLDWKISFMSELHPRFGSFLRPAREGAIAVDPTEIVWGGVYPDGIPDIRDPKMLTPAEADFLDADERVFGVSINGDARAYPLRITNPHEMVNDVVGGEPIALAW